MNKITIEFCAEDRARLDKLTAALEKRATVEVGIAVEGTEELNKRLAAALADAEEPKTEAKAETPTNTHEEEKAPENDAEKDHMPWEEAEAKAPSVTLEQIQQKVVQLAASGAEKKAKVRSVISAYGTKVSDLKEQPDKWDEVWEKLAAVESEG